jgi:16S rRNA (cytidine1402-2'-O)-methyltransferase
VTGALAVSGMSGDRFVFEGFLPKKGRERSDRLAELALEQRTIVLFVGPHQLLDDLESLAETLGSERPICVVRELTKMHEEIQWSTLGEAIDEWSDRGAKGEYTLVLAGAEPPEHSLDEAVTAAQRLVEEGTTPSQAARQAASEFRLPRREIYDRLV